MSAIEVEVEQEFRGRSLAYVRRLLGCQAQWTSAQDAWEDLREYAYIGTPEEFGAICFFEMGPWGDVGLHVGEGMVLRLVGGHPMLLDLHRDLSYLGWVDGEVFRDACSGPLPH